MNRYVFLLVPSVLLATAHHSADAALIINAIEVGNDVVFTGAGTIDLDDLTLFDFPFLSPEAQSGSNSDGPIVVVGEAGPTSFYGSTSGPTSFGTSTVRTNADSGSGDLFGIFNETGLMVPRLYVSESPLVGSMTFNNASFASLELTPGSYVWTWGNGANADSLTLNIVPEPGSLALLALAGLALLPRLRRVFLFR